VDGPSVTVTPGRPATGSFVALSIRRANRPGDSLASVSGTMAGEPLHFRADSAGVLRGFGIVPIEASDSVVARIVLRDAPGTPVPVRQSLPLPPHPRRVAGRPARARRLRVANVFTAKPDSLPEARVERENAEARAVGKHAHDTPQLWTEPFIRPRTSRITS